MSRPSPIPDSTMRETREFWAGAARGELRIPRCASPDCRHYEWYPRELCSLCGAGDLRWETVSGRGTLFSWAVVERALYAPFADKVPYVTGLVALEEDPAVRIVTNIVDCDPSRLEIDMPVRAVFRNLTFNDTDADTGERIAAPFFVPSLSAGAKDLLNDELA